MLSKPEAIIVSNLAQELITNLKTETISFESSSGTNSEANSSFKPSSSGTNSGFENRNNYQFRIQVRIQYQQFRKLKQLLFSRLQQLRNYQSFRKLKHLAFSNLTQERLAVSKTGTNSSFESSSGTTTCCENWNNEQFQSELRNYYWFRKDTDNNLWTCLELWDIHYSGRAHPPCWRRRAILVSHTMHSRLHVSPNMRESYFFGTEPFNVLQL